MKAGAPAVPALAAACLCHIQQSCTYKQTGAFLKLQGISHCDVLIELMLSVDQGAWSYSAAYAARHAGNDEQLYKTLSVQFRMTRSQIPPSAA